MKWVVDTRGKGESEIFELLQKQAPESVSVEKNTLDVGDYHLINDSDETVVVVERKTHSDLASSLKSKQHMKEQTLRLRAYKAQHPQAAVFLLYEGGMSANWYKQAIMGFPNLSGDIFMTVAASREGLCTHSTGSKEHTAAWLLRVALKETRGDLRGDGAPPSEADLLRTLATSKSGNLTSNNQWARMLMAINGISADRALAIVERFPTCRTLVEHVEKDKRAAEIDLGNIVVKRRRIGPAAARHIVSAVTQ